MRIVFDERPVNISGKLLLIILHVCNIIQYSVAQIAIMSTTQATTEPDKGGQTAHHEDTVDDEKSQPASESNLVYSNAEEEPEIHLRTYIALAAMLMLNYVQIIALQGPPVVVSA